MDAVLSPNAAQQIHQENHQVTANTLLNRFNSYANNITTLSLDCFDTLLWRKTIAPKDVFFDLQQRPTFKSLKISALNRIDAESRARKLKFVREGHYEVNLYDIYRLGFASLSESDIAALIKEENDAEKEACYAFPSIVELMRAAQTRDIKIIIVSNTYLKEKELRELLAHALPHDVYSAIHFVFASCEYNQSKTNGLFGHVLKHLGEDAKSILHIGDNYHADFISAKKQGIHALHLIQFNEKIVDYLRLQATAATLCDTSIHHQRSMTHPFRGVISSANLDVNKPESLIGYLSLGPIMYTFARFLHEEITALKKEGKNPKVLFLMRDAYLPSLAYEAYSRENLGKQIRISRFCAIAASFRHRNDIENYLLSSIASSSFDEICKQFLLPKELSEALIKQAEATTQPPEAFVQLIFQPAYLDCIIKNSKIFCAKLKKYLQKEINLQSGDTLMLVDIGYAGRTQQALTPIFKEEMGVDVVGRYLISLNVLDWHKTRRGLIDPAWCDDRTIKMICMGNTLLEELCCSGDNSVIDYDENGNPIFSESSAHEAQRIKTNKIQVECLRFIHDTNAFFRATNSTFDLSLLRDTVLAELTRRTFFPLEDEIQYLQEFWHDVNRGSNLASLTFLKPETELSDLRRQGLCFKNQSPYGLRAAGFELSLTVLSQLRHGFEVTTSDLNFRTEQVAVFTSRNQQILKRALSANSTHDGYFSLYFEVQKEDSQIALLFGLHYEALQIESIDLIDPLFFFTEKQYKHEKSLFPIILLNQMNERKNRFFECHSESSAVLIPINQVMDKEKMIFRVVFRPIIKK